MVPTHMLDLRAQRLGTFGWTLCSLPLPQRWADLLGEGPLHVGCRGLEVPPLGLGGVAPLGAVAEVVPVRLVWFHRPDRWSCVENWPLARGPCTPGCFLVGIDGGAFSGVVATPVLVEHAIWAGVVSARRVLLPRLGIAVVLLSLGFVGPAPLAVHPFLGAGARRLHMLHLPQWAPGKVPPVLTIPSLLLTRLGGTQLRLPASGIPAPRSSSS